MGLEQRLFRARGSQAGTALLHQETSAAQINEISALLMCSSGPLLWRGDRGLGFDLLNLFLEVAFFLFGLFCLVRDFFFDFFFLWGGLIFLTGFFWGKGYFNVLQVL